MSDGGSPRTAGGSGRSDEHAETGGWPPPTAEQHRYEPGVVPPRADARPDPGGVDRDTGGWPVLGPDGGFRAPAGPFRAAEPGDRPAPAGDPSGSGHPSGGESGDPSGSEDDGSPYGSGHPSSPYGSGGPYGDPYGPNGSGSPYGPGGSGDPYGADESGSPYGAGGSGSPYGAGQGGAGGPYGSVTGPAAWAPGDSAYGRLGGDQARPPARGLRARAERRFGPPERPQGLTRASVPAPARRPAARSAGTPLTYGLIAACVFVYLLQEADDSITYRFGLIPGAVTDGGEWYRLLSAAFLHAGLAHLATNMLSLYFVGTVLERVLGPARYLVLYLLSALGGSLLSVALAPAYSIGVGASGAIFGLVGALVVFRRQVGAAGSGLALLLGLNLVFTFTIPNISWQAHIGGLVTGLVVALVLLPTLRAGRR